jgi:hypothetical protein
MKALQQVETDHEDEIKQLLILRDTSLSYKETE